MHEHVAEAGDSSKALAERRRQHVGFHETIDGRAVSRRVEPGRRGDMARRVERVLRTELEAEFDDPPQIGVRTDRFAVRRRRAGAGRSAPDAGR